ncbi:hypothetical protein [Desulfoscipio geothermicus]|uniref:Uncharacterized protein n=1 Tax=Desulfoscipio geothermicus DSM 3669 TaxID=1121426 RepID=A0A1I6CYB5_9FIRM|nr:hypothetical protein [Desulfoscipio geothermicus]SFQ98208.1 hypothetical protein SAMN05660706_10361 [Desulfoscipio geothermicus DSM 3669]
MKSHLVDTALNFIIIGIPECIVLTMLVLALLRVDYAKIWQIIAVGTSMAAAVLIIRLTVQSTGIPGIHTAAAILTMAILVARYYRVSKVLSSVASIVAMILLLLTEIFCYNLFIKIFGMDVTSLAQHRLYWTLTSWLHIVCLIIITAVITRTKWYQQKNNTNGFLKNFKAR